MKDKAVILILLLSGICRAATTVDLYYNNSKKCLIKLSNRIYMIDSDTSDNINLKVKDKTQVSVLVNSKSYSNLMIKTKSQTYAFNLRYNKSAYNCFYSDSLKSKKRRSKTKALKTVNSNQTVVTEKIRYSVGKIRYYPKKVLIDLEIENDSYQDIDISKVKTSTIERAGLLGLKTKPVTFFNNSITNCQYINSKNTKKCRVRINNFKKKGYALKLRLYNTLSEDKPVEIYHKFRS